jgi:hypothetical protein
MGAGERYDCPGCKHPVIRCRNKEGVLSPISFHVWYGGDVLIFRSEDKVLECRTLPKSVLDQMRGLGVPLRKDHSDCI